jgi:hypothetical protein
MNRTQQSYQTVPDPIGGYFLEYDKGWFSIIKPENGQNDITNPSFERNTTGWTAQNSTIARAVTYQYRGIYSLKITPTNGNAAGVSYTVAGISSSVPNTMSVYLLGHPGDTYQLYAGSFGSRSVSSQIKEVVGNGRWQRLVITCHAGGALVVARKSGGTVNPFYIDAAQSEAKSYVTTYIDGDEPGMLPYVQSYWWEGLSHASRSQRLANGNGGREMRLLDLGFRLMAVLGFGMLPIINAVLPLANGGGMYQRSVYQSRQFTLAGAITGTSLSEVQKQRSELIELCSPFNLGEQQPLLMKYHVIDGDGQEALAGNIECAYESGLEGSLDNFNQDRSGIVFRQFIPLITNDQTNAASYVKPAYFSEAGQILQMNRYGIFSLVSPGVSAAIQAIAFAMNENGDLFLGGRAAPYLYKWDGSSYTLVGATSPNGAVLAITKSYSGGLSVGGKFTAITGIANTAHIAFTDGSNWIAVGTGTNGDVNAIVETPERNGIYLAGAFTLAGGVADTTRIARWNGTAYVPLGTGIPDGVVYDMKLDSIGNLYVAGSFTSAGGVANTASIAKWNGTVWSSVGDGNTDAPVRSIVFGADGNLYAGGNFTTIGGVAADNFSMWNGASWVDLNPPDFAAPYYTGSKMVALPTGEILMNIKAEAKYGTNYAIYNRGQFHPGLSHSVTYSFDNDGPKWLNPNTNDVYFGQDVDSGGTRYGYIANLTSTVANDSPVITYPVIYIQGPIPRLTAVINQTNGSKIYFSAKFDATDLEIYKDELVKITTGPSNFSIISNVRGNLSSYVTPDSSAIFYLSPGDNLLSMSETMFPTITGDDAIFQRLELSGFTQDNTDNGRLYATFTKPGATAVLHIYKDAARTLEVAQTGAVTTGAITQIDQVNASGIYGLYELAYAYDTDKTFTIDVPLIFVAYQESYLSIDQMRP